MPMSKFDNPSPFILQYDSGSTSSEEYSSSEDGEAPQVQNRSGSHNVDRNSSFEDDEVLMLQDRGEGHNINRQERVDPFDKTTLADDSKGHRDSLPERDLVRKIPKPTVLTTAQQRTMMNMFGVTNTEYTQTAITDPVLYVALYSTGEAPSEVDDYHWGFIVGPSHEEADSKGTLYNMEARQALKYDHPFVSEWQWLYNQPTIPLRGQDDLLVRLMIAEVADMNMLQALILRWGESISMREHVEWMSVKWVKNVLQSLEEEGGCLGRRMESFESVEAEGRWLAETEKEKRKGFSMLHRRVSRRTLFEREGISALSSTATADIAINYPVLYVGVYSSDHAYEDGQYHWAFLIGPSNEKAGSEGVCCGMDFQLDPTGQPTRICNQTIVALRKEDNLLMRRLVAEIVDLGPLAKIIRDQNSTKTAECTGSMAEDPDWTSLAWVREKLERLEIEPECFASKCHDFSMVEWIGMKVAKSSDQKWKNSRMPIGTETLCLVSGWKKPDDEEVAVLVKLDHARGKPDTISRAIQTITGVLGVAVLGLRRRVFQREKRELEDKQNEVASARTKPDDLATTLAEATKPQGVNEATEIAKQVEEQEATARPESTRITTINFGKLSQPERASERKLVAEEVEGDRDQSKDETEDEEDEESGDEDDEDDEEDEEDEDDDEDSEDDEDEGEAKGNLAEKRANARPDHVWSTTIHVPELSQPHQAARTERPAQEDENDQDETEGNEEDEEDSDEDEDESSEDGDESSDEEDEASDEEDDEDGDDDGDEDEGEEEGEKDDVEESARSQTTVKNMSTIALSN